MSDPQAIIDGLGGSENITIIEPCITRLRVEVADPAKVNEDELTGAGAFGVVQVDKTVQVVVGPVAEDLAAQISELR